MYKTTVFIFALTLLILTFSQVGTADYYVFNGSDTTDAWVVYSTWRDASSGYPDGFRTKGWYKVAPGSLRTLSVPSGNKYVYLRITRPYPTEVRPSDHATRDNFLFWMHPTEAFTAVETTNGTFLKSDRSKGSLTTKRFYEYSNNNRFTIGGRYRLGISNQTYTVSGEKRLWQVFANDITAFGDLRDGTKRFDVPGRVLRYEYTYTKGGTSWEKINSVSASGNSVYLKFSVDRGVFLYGKLTVRMKIFYRIDPAAGAPSAALQQVQPITVLPPQTTLLSNYPNPFNPETWIPYQLAKPAEVTVTIHGADGKLVRTLELGQLLAGVYQDKDRAAYWDGKNRQGEPVASGVYFYTLKAGDFAATKKMLIKK